MTILFWTYFYLVFIVYYNFIGDPFTMENTYISFVAYAIPATAIVLRLPMIRYYRFLSSNLTSAQKDSENSKSTTQASVAISMSVFLAIILTQINMGTNNNPEILQTPMYYISLSVFCYIVSHTIEAYKNTNFRNQVTLAFYDTGKLTFILTLLSLMWVSTLDKWLVYFSCFIFLGAWVTDCQYRIHIWMNTAKDIDKGLKSE